MSTTTILRNARIINEGTDVVADVLIKSGQSSASRHKFHTTDARKTLS